MSTFKVNVKQDKHNTHLIEQSTTKELSAKNRRPPEFGQNFPNGGTLPYDFFTIQLNYLIAKLYNEPEESKRDDIVEGENTEFEKKNKNKKEEFDAIYELVRTHVNDSVIIDSEYNGVYVMVLLGQINKRINDLCTPKCVKIKILDKIFTYLFSASGNKNIDDKLKQIIRFAEGSKKDKERFEYDASRSGKYKLDEINQLLDAKINFGTSYNMSSVSTRLFKNDLIFVSESILQLLLPIKLIIQSYFSIECICNGNGHKCKRKCECDLTCDDACKFVFSKLFFINSDAVQIYYQVKKIKQVEDINK